jgi:hypothetical protein
LTRASQNGAAPIGPPPEIVAQAAQHFAAALAVLAPYLGAVHAPPASESARPAEPLVDRRELARCLSVSVAQVDRLVAQGMPFLVVGESKRFDVAEVRAWCRAKAEQEAAAPSSSAPRALPSRAANDEPATGGVRILSRPRSAGGAR